MASSSPASWFVYILQSTVTGRLYTGMTNNPPARLARHNAGTGAKYTRTGRPWKIAYLSPCESKGDALRLEARIKKRSRAAKLALIHSWGKSSVIE